LEAEDDSWGLFAPKDYEFFSINKKKVRIPPEMSEDEGVQFLMTFEISADI